MLEWVPAGLNTGALNGAKASSSRTRDSRFDYNKLVLLNILVYVKDLVS
jgi:hypothetical protein